MKTAILMGAVTASAALAFAMTGSAANSGLKPGEFVTPFHPTHIVGPLAGTTNCFPCTFQDRPQVQVWVNGDSQSNIDAIAADLQKAMDSNKGAEFKALIVYIAPKSEHDKLAKLIKSRAGKDGKDAVDIAVIDPGNDALEAYKINTDKSVKNTVLVYKNRQVKDTIVNLTADKAGIGSLNTAIASIVK